MNVFCNKFYINHFILFYSWSLSLSLSIHPSIHHLSLSSFCCAISHLYLCPAGNQWFFLPSFPFTGAVVSELLRRVCQSPRCHLLPAASGSGGIPGFPAGTGSGLCGSSPRPESPAQRREDCVPGVQASWLVPKIMPLSSPTGRRWRSRAQGAARGARKSANCGGFCRLLHALARTGD